MQIQFTFHVERVQECFQPALEFQEYISKLYETR